MTIIELRNSDDARRFALQGLWLQRVVEPTEETVSAPLVWGLELLSAGEALPPLGFVADVGHLVLADAGVHRHRTHRQDEQPILPVDMIRRYEDYALGKLYADGTFERGATAVCRYADSDRSRGTAWLIARFAERAEVGGVQMSPNVLRSLLQTPREQVLAEGAESVRRDGLMPLLAECYERIIERVRNLGDVLGNEDVFELEHGTALVEFAQRLALRHLLQAAARLEAAVPERPPRMMTRHQNVPTHLLDEDTYPVGGFSSISTRGTIESLLHSQLAYMEPEAHKRPDLFDIKFLRDELLYYSRDENEFLRRRRTVIFVLSPDLTEARLKDAGLPWQRIILVLSTMLVTIRRMLDWLSDEALHFEVLVADQPESQALQDERALLGMVLAEQIANHTVRLGTISPSDVTAHIAETGRRSLTSLVLISVGDWPIDIEEAVRLRVAKTQPSLATAKGVIELDRAELAGWPAAATEILMSLTGAGG